MQMLKSNWKRLQFNIKIKKETEIENSSNLLAFSSYFSYNKRKKNRIFKTHIRDLCAHDRVQPGFSRLFFFSSPNFSPFIQRGSVEEKERGILDSLHTPFRFLEEVKKREKEAERIPAFFCPLFCFFFLKRKRWRRKRGKISVILPPHSLCLF